MRCQRPRQLAPRSFGSGRKSAVFWDGWRMVPTIRSSGTLRRPIGRRGAAVAPGYRSSSDGSTSRSARRRRSASRLPPAQGATRAAEEEHEQDEVGQAAGQPSDDIEDTLHWDIESRLCGLRSVL